MADDVKLHGLRSSPTHPVSHLGSLQLKSLSYECVAEDIVCKSESLVQYDTVLKKMSWVRFWAKFNDEKSIPMMAFFRHVGEDQEKATNFILDTLKTIEENGLGRNKNFFGGEEVSLADIALGWITHTLPLMEDRVGAKLVKAETFPLLHEWTENFKQVSVIKASLPDYERAMDYFRAKREMFNKLADGKDPSI
ncbi:hypothetical protein BT93_H0230 [Corymbia citriodora subsp. variegata]|nr:hypothetical protein BT93_H0230 [Corymbia citriodora subsp. variegata]